MHFFVTQLRFAKNFRLQLELHEFLHAFSLHEHLWSFLVNRHTQFVLLREENRPFLRRELEAEFFKQSPQLYDLFLRERMSVRIQRPTLNAQARLRQAGGAAAAQTLKPCVIRDGKSSESNLGTFRDVSTPLDMTS